METSVLKHVQIFGCNNKKICVFMHGSSGFIPSNMWYIRLLVSLGYKVFAPDHTKYCKKCLGYSSSLKNYTRKNSKLPSLYQHIVKLRSFELHVVVKMLIKLGYTDITLVGISEGALPVAMHSEHKKHISKKILLSYSPERHYFNYSTLKNPLNSHSSCKVLNIIGTNDEYFAKINSVGSEIAKHYNKKRLNGNGKCSCKNFNCNVFVLYGTHDLTLNNKKNLKYIIKDFTLT